MPAVENRKYEVTLPDGRVVSRQRAHQIKQGEAYDERFKEYRNRPDVKEKRRAYQEQWLADFEEEHGMSYYQWRKANKED